MLSKTTNVTAKSKSDEDMDDMGPSSIMVGVDQEVGRVVLQIRGAIQQPAVYSDALNSLREMARQYDTCMIYLNSPGGDVSTLCELMDILKTYRNLITIVNGIAMSAAFMIWCMGNIRVTSRTSLIMAHREGYQYTGKTPQHVVFSEVNQRLFQPIFATYVVRGIMTEEEVNDAGKTDVFFTGNEMIERGVAISYESFIEADTTLPVPYHRSYINIGGIEYELLDSCCGVRVNALETDDDFNVAVNLIELHYNTEITSGGSGIAGEDEVNITDMQ